MNEPYKDEIDLFEFFKILWSGKLLIVGFTALSLLLGSGFLAVKEAEYESIIFIKTEKFESFYSSDRILTDFEELFFSPQTFGDWKRSAGTTSLNFRDFSKTKDVDGFELSIGQNDLMVQIDLEKKNYISLNISSNQPNVLDDFFNYSNYVINLLNDDYLKSAKSELRSIERLIDKVALENMDYCIVEKLLSNNRLVSSLQNGEDVFLVDRPTIPKKVSPKRDLVLVLSILFGGLSGVFSILIRRAIAGHPHNTTWAKEKPNTNVS